jgi:hypothetical protein
MAESSRQGKYDSTYGLINNPLPPVAMSPMSFASAMGSRGLGMRLAAIRTFRQRENRLLHPKPRDHL